ncbi:MAG: NAD(P)/FAD-dependent oxidoreductase [Thermoleophilia bacterium]
MSALEYDVIIVGAGPAGIFAALELTRSPELRVLLLEKGCDIRDRSCPARRTGRCAHCDPCDITCGWGGAGAFSDGKLTLSPEVGGWLGEYVTPEDLGRLIADVDAVYRRFGAPDEVYGGESEEFAAWRLRALKEGLRLVQSPIRHIGTERCAELMARLRDELGGRADVRTDSMVSQLLVEKDGGALTGLRTTGVATTSGEEFRAPHVVVAPGREGSSWFLGELRRLGVPVTNNAVDIGVRVEVPSVVTDPITDSLYEPKLLYTSRHFEDPVRTFCMNPHGEVSKENYGDVVTVNGHSYADRARQTLCTNFALLVSTRFTEPFDEPIVYGKSIARLANVLGEDIIVQRLGDLKSGRRSTPERIGRSAVEPTLKDATPGDLSFVMPYRHLRDITDMLAAMDRLLPGVGGRDTLLYGTEVKFYSARPGLNRELETGVEGLYAIGDGAGITRGLVQASASGLVAGRSVRRRLSGPADPD